MAQQVIDVGTSASDGTGDPLRDAFTKVNDNFTELYGTAENQGLTYGNVSSNVAGVTFNVTRYTESYTATPVLEGTGQSVGNVYVIQGNVLGGSTPINDVYLTVTALANVTVGNIATVSAVGTPTAPVLRVNGLTGNVTLTVNNIDGAASRAYVNAAIAANVANVTGTITDSLRANITAANAAISSNSARISTLESNAATQAAAISNLDNTKATISYVDTSIDLALSSNAILADVAAVNANVAAANAAILLRANLSGADFTGNITANGIRGLDSIRAETYFVAGTEALQQLGESWANPAALFFGNSAAPGSPTLYYQINLQNLDPAGSGDIVVTADDGNDLEHYIAMGVNGSQYSDPLHPFGLAHDGYLAVFGGNLKLQSNTANIELLAGNLTTAQVSLTTGNVLHLNSNVVIKFSDGTVQSTAFGGNANVTSINANVTAANLAIAGLQSNAAAQALDIDALYANAGTQAASLSTLTANAATQAISIAGLLSNVTTLISNAATQSVAISSLQSNTAAANLIITALTANSATQALELDNLQSNAQAQQSAIIVLQSNSSVQAVAIDLLNANITAANTNIASLTSNAATQSSQINLLNANVTAANVNITTLFANAASQALDIDNLYANVNYYLANVASSDANIAAANARIVILDANLGSTSSNVSALESNAAAQALSIDLLNANVTAANVNIDNKADLSGAIFDGNIQANYIFANSNIHVASILQVGNTSPNNIPGLGSIFVGNVTTDYQVVIQNLSTSSNATTALKILPDDGYDENNFIKIGINSSQYLGNVILPQGDSNLIGSPRDGYVVTYGGNTSIRSDRNIFMAANTVVVGLIKDSNNFALISANLQFSDGTIQTTAIQDVSGLYANIGALAVFQSNILGNATYTPNNASNYNGTITNIQQALDELAARLRALGG
jgi:uncharacterized coiled-coil protein SlyX